MEQGLFALVITVHFACYIWLYCIMLLLPIAILVFVCPLILSIVVALYCCYLTGVVYSSTGVAYSSTGVAYADSRVILPGTVLYEGLDLVPRRKLVPTLRSGDEALYMDLDICVGRNPTNHIVALIRAAGLLNGAP